MKPAGLAIAADTGIRATRVPLSDKHAHSDGSNTASEACIVGERCESHGASWSDSLCSAALLPACAMSAGRVRRSNCFKRQLNGKRWLRALVRLLLSSMTQRSSRTTSVGSRRRVRHRSHLVHLPFVFRQVWTRRCVKSIGPNIPHFARKTYLQKDKAHTRKPKKPPGTAPFRRSCSMQLFDGAQ